MDRSDQNERATRTSRITIVLLLMTLASGCAQETTLSRSTPQTYSRSGRGSLFVKMSAGTYPIKQGDQIDVTVWGYPEFNTKTIVKDGGIVTIPLVGDIKAEGSSKEQFSDDVRSKLSQYIKGDVKVNVSVSSLTTQRIAVLGAVVRQDNYPIAGSVSLIEALSGAGGTTAESDLHHVKIIRNGGLDEPVIVDVEDYIENGTTDAMPTVQPGDAVFVPKKENAVRDLSDFLRDVVLLFGFFRVFY